MLVGSVGKIVFCKARYRHLLLFGFGEDVVRVFTYLLHEDDFCVSTTPLHILRNTQCVFRSIGCSGGGGVIQVHDEGVIFNKGLFVMSFGNFQSRTRFPSIFLEWCFP